MRLYLYRGLDNERAPKDVTRVIIDDSITIIRGEALCVCKSLVSVIMGENVKRIGAFAFMNCHALRFIRLSKKLESVGVFALYLCRSLEALFLPSTLKAIEENAFAGCQSLRLLILPNAIVLTNVSKGIIFGTTIKEAVVAAGVMHEYDCNDNWRYNKSSCLVNKWLYHHMDGSPFHKLCYNSSITT